MGTQIHQAGPGRRGSDVEALADLPVAVDVDGDWRDELVTWLEGDLRWQVVGGDGALRPQVRISDDPTDGTATVVMVDGGASEDDPTTAGTGGHRPAGAGSAARTAGAAAVLRWPQDRGRLPSIVLHAVRPGAARTDGGCRVVRIGGLGGGVGTSTVALAVGALAAWRGRRTVVVGGDDLLHLCGAAPWRGPGALEVAALSAMDAGREVVALAHPVPGVDHLTVIGGSGRSPLPDRLPWPFDLVVVDLRAGWETADIVVGRAGCRRPVAPVRGRLLVQDADGVSRPEAAALLDAAPSGWLTDDPRVRRAGAAGRAPAGLPGRWLRQLDRALGRGVRRAA